MPKIVPKAISVPLLKFFSMGKYTTKQANRMCGINDLCATHNSVDDLIRLGLVAAVEVTDSSVVRGRKVIWYKVTTKGASILSSLGLPSDYTPVVDGDAGDC